MQAYSPLVRGQRFGEPNLKNVAKKYGKTDAQVLMGWSLQKVCVTALYQSKEQKLTDPM